MLHPVAGSNTNADELLRDDFIGWYNVYIECQ